MKASAGPGIVLLVLTSTCWPALAAAQPAETGAPGHLVRAREFLQGMRFHGKPRHIAYVAQLRDQAVGTINEAIQDRATIVEKATIVRALDLITTLKQHAPRPDNQEALANARREINAASDLLDLAERLIASARNLKSKFPERYKYDYDWDGPGGLKPPMFKCNLFVYDALKGSGIDVGLRLRGSKKPPRVYESPPVANEWATDDIPGFKKIIGGKPRPGDVIIRPASAEGHMGIVTAPGSTISVLSPSRGDTIEENDFGFGKNGTYVIQRLASP